MANTKPATIDEYIDAFPKATQQVLQKIRQTIRKVIPNGDEVISYAIPAFKFGGKNVVYFSGWKEHVSLYPIPAGDQAFQKAISPYKAGRGTIRFGLDKPIPYDLVEKITRLLLKEQQLRG